MSFCGCLCLCLIKYKEYIEKMAHVFDFGSELGKRKLEVFPTPTECSTVFSYTRMNPPTPGHMELIKEMIRIATTYGINHIDIILSPTINKKSSEWENPLPCEEKKYFLDIMVAKLYPGFVVNVRCTEKDPEKDCYLSMPSMVQKVINEYKTAGIARMVVGEDRTETFTKVFASNPEIEVELGIPRPNMESTKNVTIPILKTIDPTHTPPPGSISASFVRKVVIANNKPLFHAIYQSYIVDPKIRDSLFETLESRLPSEQKYSDIMGRKRTSATPSKKSASSTATAKKQKRKADSKAEEEEEEVSEPKEEKKRRKTTKGGRGRGRRKTYKKYKKPLY